MHATGVVEQELAMRVDYEPRGLATEICCPGHVGLEVGVALQAVPHRAPGESGGWQPFHPLAHMRKCGLKVTFDRHRHRHRPERRSQRL